MPELPEVETIRLGLLKTLKDVVIKDVIVRNPHFRWKVDVETLQNARNHKIRTIKRRAKYLLLELDDKSHILLHLGMSGRLLLTPPQEPKLKHDHVIFTFNKKIELRFNDVRRFGYVQYLAPGDECSHRLLKDLGLEPLEDDFTYEYLVDKSASRSLPVKNFLMDSKIVVGLGNIYANEALFRARIHPLRSVSKLTPDEWQNLRNAVRHVLRAAVRAGGTTLQDEAYRSADGELGYFQMKLKVYQREGEKCAKCNTAIEKITMSGRSTFFCPSCQKYE